MKNNEALGTVLEDIERLLDGIVLSGISVIQEGTLREMNRLAVSCGELGLKEGAAMLLNLEEILNKKRHTLSFNIDEAVNELVILGAYVSLVKGKMRVI